MADPVRVPRSLRPLYSRTPRELRLEHVRKHLVGSPAADEIIALVPLLVKPLPIAAIARRLGPGYTTRWVERRWYFLRERLLLRHHDRGGASLSRLALACILDGDPCWCEA